MRLTDQEIRAIAEDLQLLYTVWIHKETGRRISIPATASFFMLSEAMQQAQEEVLYNEKEYLRIDPPPRQSFFYDFAYSTFPYNYELTASEHLDMESAVDTLKVNGDERPFLRQVEKLGKVQEWIEYQQHSYTKYVKECIYPFNEAMIFIQ